MSARPVDGDRLPPLVGNPYLDAYRCWQAAPGLVDRPDELLSKFGFVIPSADALELIAVHSPAGVVEVGAGTGYWARLLHERDVDVVAYDVAPPPSRDNAWLAGQQPWFPVEAGDERIVARHPERTLLLIWPTRNEEWAADAARLHLEHGGQRLVYVGEPPGGRTGDIRLHARLNLIGPCLACAYSVTNIPCTCSVTTRWQLLTQVALPCMDDRDDRLYVFGRPPAKRRLGRWGGRFRQRLAP